MTSLQKLTVERMAELGEEAFLIHQEMDKWRKEPLTDMERTKMTLKIQAALELQRKLADALLEDVEDK